MKWSLDIAKERMRRIKEAELQAQQRRNREKMKAAEDFLLMMGGGDIT